MDDYRPWMNYGSFREILPLNGGRIVDPYIILAGCIADAVNDLVNLTGLEGGAHFDDITLLVSNEGGHLAANGIYQGNSLFRLEKNNQTSKLRLGKFRDGTVMQILRETYRGALSKQITTTSKISTTDARQLALFDFQPKSTGLAN